MSSIFDNSADYDDEEQVSTSKGDKSITATFVMKEVQNLKRKVGAHDKKLKEHDKILEQHDERMFGQEKTQELLAKILKKKATPEKKKKAAKHSEGEEEEEKPLKKKKATKKKVENDSTTDEEGGKVGRPNTNARVDLVYKKKRVEGIVKKKGNTYYPSVGSRIFLCNSLKKSEFEDGGSVTLDFGNCETCPEFFEKKFNGDETRGHPACKKKSKK